MNKMKLGDILKIKHGYAFKGENFSDEGEFILLTPANFYESGGFKYTPGKEKYYLGDFPQEYLCKKGDLIVAMTQQAEGLLGSTAIVPEDNIYLHNQRIGLITVDETKADKKFVDYLFRTKNVRFQIEGSSSGTKVKHTSPDKIYDVDVWLPDLDNQRKIGEILSTIDETIRKNNNINQELEELAQTIYNYWFVQFEFPNEEGKPYKSNGGEMVWNDKMQREIPTGWEIKNILELVNWIGGAQPPKKEHTNEFREGYVRFIQNRDYQGDNHITYIKESPSNKLCNKYDIMMDKYGEAGKVRYGIEGAYNVALAKLELLEPETQEYIRKFFEDNNTLEYLKNASIASTRASLNSQTLGTLNICLPKKELLIQFENIGKNILDIILSNKEKNQELIKIRDFIFPLLMNGQAKLN